MLRLITNKAKHHFNLAIEHAERNRYYQAITELQNSIDLDKTNIAAHVLLGTIYAKQDKFDLAIKEWDAALSLNTNLYKAYQYIERAEKVKSALPVLKWVKLLLGALLVSLICIVILSFNLIRPHPSENLIETAISEYKQKRYGSALETTQIFSRKYGSSPFLPLSQILKESIQNRIEEYKQKIRSRLQSGDYSGALEMCNQLESYHPDPETRQFIKQRREDTKFSMKESIEKSLAEQSISKGDITPIKRQIEIFSKYFQADPVIDIYHSQLAALEEQDKKKEQTDLENKLNEILEIQDPEKVLSELIRFNRLYPDFASKAFVSRSIHETRKTLYYNQFQIIQDFMNQNNFEAAEKSLAKLSSSELSEFPLLFHEYNNLKSMLSRRVSDQKQEKTQQYLQKLEETLGSGNISKALILISKKDSYPLSGSDLARIQKIRDEIQIQQATQTLHNIIHGTRFDNLDAFSREDAEKILSEISRLQKNLPENLYHQFKDHLLYLSCASHMKLGESEKAQEIFQNLLHEFPHSPFLTRAVKILKQ